MMDGSFLPRDSMVSSFVNAVAASDVQFIERAQTHTFDGVIWRDILREILNLEFIADSAKNALHTMVIVSGGHIRKKVKDDFLIIDALWKMLTPYDGPSVVLFRGEAIPNHLSRTYGHSWSLNIENAKAFTYYWREDEGGSVLLKTLAPAEAIISGPNDHSRYLGESEFILDRRKIGLVEAIDVPANGWA